MRQTGWFGGEFMLQSGHVNKIMPTHGLFLVFSLSRPGPYRNPFDMPYNLLSPYQTPQIRMTIGLYIRRLRIEKGLSQSGLCQEIGLPESTLSKIENGRVRLTKNHLERLEKALDFDPTDVQDLSRILALQYMNEVSQQILGTYPE